MQQRQTTRCGPLVTLLIVCFFTADVFGDARTGSELLTGNAAMGDWTTDAPGVRRKLTVADLLAPYATESVRNHPREVPQPAGALFVSAKAATSSGAYHTRE
jgi:hypothetical protein